MSDAHYTWFDRWVARMRHNVAHRCLSPGARVCDVGCGVDALFLKAIVPTTRFRLGLDYQRIAARVPNTHFVQTDITAGLPLRENSFDHVTLLAVLEHLKDPVPVFVEAHRALKPGGSLIITWPNAAVDPLVSVLMRIGVVAPETEADQHQPRKPVSHWIQALRRIGFGEITHRTFEFGLNNLMVAQKGR